MFQLNPFYMQIRIRMVLADKKIKAIVPSSGI
jgi:hypothetical protein